MKRLQSRRRNKPVIQLSEIDMEVEIEYELERDDYQVLIIRGYAEPQVPARLSGHPDTWEPGSGGTACIEGIFLDNGQPWPDQLTADEQQQVEDMLYQRMEERLDEIAEGIAEAKFERMRDY